MLLYRTPYVLATLHGTPPDHVWAPCLFLRAWQVGVLAEAGHPRPSSAELSPASAGSQWLGWWQPQPGWPTLVPMAEAGDLGSKHMEPLEAGAWHAVPLATICQSQRVTGHAITVKPGRPLYVDGHTVSLRWGGVRLRPVSAISPPQWCSGQFSSGKPSCLVSARCLPRGL